MVYSAFVFFMCLFIISGTAVLTKSKGFYISGYNTTHAININKTATKYQYEKNEVLNLTCHNKQKKPVIWLRWWHNERNVPGIEDSSNENKLSLNISKSNDKDRLTCYAFEDDTGLMKNEKKYEKTAILILDYVGREDTTTSGYIQNKQDNKGDNGESDNWFDELSKRTLFWIGLVVAVVVIILAILIVVASKRTYGIKEDRVVLHPAVSDVSVFSTESKTSIIPKTTERSLYTNETFGKTQLHAPHEIIHSEYQEPIDSQAYCEPQTYCEPDTLLYAEPIPRILRQKKNNVYVNYNTNNDSVYISNKNMDLYQNCENICNDELIAGRVETYEGL